MNHASPFDSATLPHVPSLISRSPLWLGFPAVLLVLGLFALSPTAQAVMPPPDGGYPNRNTAEGDGALLSLTTGARNTAIGTSAVFFNTTGSNNTAVGDSALGGNTLSDNNTAIG